jgi:micrococcal nuclease
MKTRYLIPRILLLFLLICTTAFASKEEINHGKVMQVKDGDTVVISPVEGGQFYTCRLYGIDTPEITHGKKPGQPYGEEASKGLKRLILGQTVEVTTTGAKIYNREVCMIKKAGQDINLEMVKLGYAWAYKQYLKRPYASEYIDAERSAREKHLGLWKDNNPTPPWEFRKRQRQ